MKLIASLLILLTSLNAFAGYEAGSADQVLVVPHAGGRPQYGQVDLSQSAAVKNQLPSSKGGLGIDTSASTGCALVSGGTWSVSSLLACFQTLYKTVATATGDLLYGGASGTPTKLAIGNTNQVLTVVGGVPAWQNLNASFTSATKQVFTSTGTITGYMFTVTSANATVGATYTNNAQTFTVLATIAGSTQLFCSSTGAPAASGTLTKSGGTGDSTITFSADQGMATYTTPAGVLFLHVRGVGGGGGGGGSAGSAGSAGLYTLFGTNMLIGAPGSGGNGGGGSPGGTGGAGGVATVNSPAQALQVITGGDGHGGVAVATIAGVSCSGGGTGILGEGGDGGTPSGSAGVTGRANTGGGGGGAKGSTGATLPGGGGGGGGFFEALIPAPSGTYFYSVGTGGAGGSSTLNGAPGAAGGLIVEELYQ